MEKEIRKNIILHMKQTGGIKDYSEKRAQSILNHYYEMSYPDREILEEQECLQIKITIPVWLRTLESY